MQLGVVTVKLLIADFHYCSLLGSTPIHLPPAKSTVAAFWLIMERLWALCTLDFSRAFDTVSHSQTLAAHGPDMWIFFWAGNWLGG